MRTLFQAVIEDNLEQLRYDVQGEREEAAAEAESRLLSNVAVLIAAGFVANPETYCSEMLGRLDEIRLHGGAALEMLDPGQVGEDMGSHRFTYLHLHNGEVCAAHAVVKTEGRPHPTLQPKRSQGFAGLERAAEDPQWPLKEVPSQPITLAEDLPNFVGTYPNLMQLVDRLSRMPDIDRKHFERSGNVRRIRWHPQRDAFEIEMDCGVTWRFNKWDQTPGRIFSTPNGADAED